MRKSTKGALAVGAAGVLLLGGAGTLAYWTESADVDGADLEAGHLAITANTCGTAPWMLDGGLIEAEDALIVPGDTIAKECTFTVTGEGDHFEDVDIAIAAPNWTIGSDADLVSALGVVSADYDGSSVGPITTGDDIPVGEVVTASFALTFSAATTGDTAEDALATLDTIAITVTQNHS